LRPSLNAAARRCVAWISLVGGWEGWRKPRHPADSDIVPCRSWRDRESSSHRCDLRGPILRSCKYRQARLAGYPRRADIDFVHDGIGKDLEVSHPWPLCNTLVHRFDFGLGNVLSLVTPTPEFSTWPPPPRFGSLFFCFSERSGRSLRSVRLDGGPRRPERLSILRFDRVLRIFRGVFEAIEGGFEITLACDSAHDSPLIAKSIPRRTIPEKNQCRNVSGHMTRSKR
jgi:hypothetical protein